MAWRQSNPCGGCNRNKSLHILKRVQRVWWHMAGEKRVKMRGHDLAHDSDNTQFGLRVMRFGGYIWVLSLSFVCRPWHERCFPVWWWVILIQISIAGDRWSAELARPKPLKSEKSPHCAAGWSVSLDTGVRQEAESRWSWLGDVWGSGWRQPCPSLCWPPSDVGPRHPALSTHSYSSDRPGCSALCTHTLLNITNTKMQFLASPVTSIMQVNHTVTQGRSIWPLWSNRDLWNYEVLDILISC